MIKFKTGTLTRSLIEKVEVERETDFFVWINNRKEGKNTGYDQIWDNWDDAKEYLLDKARTRKQRAEDELTKSIAELAKILNLTPID